ncbi:hypothetical protein GCM10027422_48700 [Hymenobacter arcticus]
MSVSLPPLPGNLAAPYPVLLLPVGVQVKFMQPPTGPRQLWVRIYPDQLSISTHEEPLTAAELQAGQAWHDQAPTEDAWRALVARFGAPRAQWIVRQTAGSTPPPTTTTPWSRAAEARGLPQRFAVLLYRPAQALADMADGPAKELLFPSGRPYSAEALPRPTSEFLALYKAVEGLDLPHDPQDPTKGLAVGMTPQAGATTPDIGGVDDGNKWTVDFETARLAGMAVKIDLDKLTDDEITAGFARLVVVGVRLAEAGSPAAASGAPVGQEALAGLLADHTYTSGAHLVAQGTPTNNTDSGVAGFSSVERTDAAATFGLAGPPAGFDAGKAWADRPDGQHLARTLGLPDAVVSALGGALSQHDVAEALAVNRALWPATYGYFLEEMLRPLLSADDLAWTRDFFENFVVARGLAPALRVGAQPYGVLTTTHFAAWETDPNAPDHARAARLQAVLGQLDAVWTERLNPQDSLYPPTLAGAATADKTTFVPPATAADGLLATLGLDATSTQYYQRYLIGPLLAEALQAHAVGLPTGIWAAGDRTLGVFPPTDNPVYQEFARLIDPHNDAHLQRDAQNLPVAAPPLFAHTFQSTFNKLAEAYSDEPGNRRQEGALIDEGLLSEDKPVALLPGVEVNGLKLNYIQWLATASFDDIRLERFDSSLGNDFPPPNTLLYRLLRQAVLLEYWAAAKRALALAGPDVLDGETFNVLATGQTPRWAWLYKQVNGQELYKSLTTSTPSNAPLNDYLATVGALGSLPTARLERLLAEHLDLGSYRLDAWRLAPVVQRLRTLRGTYPTGSHLGAFGWLEDVRPQDEAAPNKAGNYDDPDNLGYLHAPSLAHATAAALLRQGYKSRQRTPDPTDPVAARMAIDVSSRRVRAALVLLEGLRGGHSLGTLLGQSFERAVQAHAGTAGGKPYASYLPLFRSAFPLSEEHALVPGAGQAVPTGTAPDQAARQVVDGAALLRAAAQHPAYPHGVYGAGLPAAGTDFAAFITAELGRLTDDLDALGDLGVSEGLFQAARGNTDRAAAVLDGVAKGLFPPVPDVMHPPQRSFTLTQRVLVQLPAPLTSASPWYQAQPTPRAAAAPRLNAWLAQFFPNPSVLPLAVGWRDAQGSWPLSDVLLDQAGLSPIDLLYLLDDHALQAGSTFDRLLRYHLGQQAYVQRLPHNAGDELALDYTAGTAAPELRRLLPLLARLRQLLGGARPARPYDLQAPGRQAADNPDTGVADPDLGDRLDNAQYDLTQLPGTGALTPAQFYQAALYGLTEALPGLAPGADQAALAAASRALRPTLALRLAAAQALLPAQTVADRLAQASALFGPAFRPDVEFSLTDARTTDPDQVQAQAEAQQDYSHALDPQATTSLLRHYQGQPLALQEWLHGLGAVREPLNHLDKVFLIKSLLDPEALAEPTQVLRPAQLTALPGTAPDGQGDYWLGLPWPTTVPPGYPGPAYAPPGDALSLVQWLPAGYQPAATQCALWLDEWTETLPLASQPTAVAFHYDQPNAAAPQAMLLVVPPQAQPSGFWTTETLAGAVNQTLDLAKKRTVEPAALAATPLATVLPAVVAPVAQQAVTLTLDLGRLNGTARFNEEPLKVPLAIP